MPDPARDPARTCVACRREGAKRGLLRLVRRLDGTVAFDAGGRAAGRGAYLHPEPACVEQARKRRAVERSLKARVSDELWAELAEVLLRPA